MVMWCMKLSLSGDVALLIAAWLSGCASDGKVGDELDLPFEVMVARYRKLNSGMSRAAVLKTLGSVESGVDARPFGFTSIRQWFSPSASAEGNRFGVVMNFDRYGRLAYRPVYFQHRPSAADPTHQHIVESGERVVFEEDEPPARKRFRGSRSSRSPRFHRGEKPHPFFLWELVPW